MAQRNCPGDRTAARPNRSRSVGEGKNLGKTFVPPPRRFRLRARQPLPKKRLLSQVKAIADTGFLVAFWNRNDAFHSWAVSLAKRVTEPLLTCEAVLAETAFHIGSTALTLSFITEGLIRLAFNASDHLTRLQELATRYADRRPDLADLCLIHMSELHPTYPVITTDLNDFRIYRRGRREAIPLIHPPSQKRRKREPAI